MFKGISEYEIKIGERSYRFTCQNDSPLGEVHDVLSTMKYYVIQKINEINDRESAANKQTSSDEESIPCCMEE